MIAARRHATPMIFFCRSLICRLQRCSRVNIDYRYDVAIKAEAALLKIC